MKKYRFLLVALIFLLVSLGCEETSTDPNSESIALLTTGIWELSPDTEVGQIGVQLKYHADGTAQVRETANSDWYADSLQWTLSDDGEELTVTGTDGPGTMDKLEILELTDSIFRGRIMDSTSSTAIGKIMKMFKVQE